MLKTDRIVKNALVKLNPYYTDELRYFPNTKQLCIVKNYDEIIRSVPVKLESYDVDLSIERLINGSWLKYSTKFMGGYTFSITARFKLRKEYWWDNFSHRFVYGFLSGIVSGVIISVVVKVASAFLLLRLGLL